MKRPRSGSTVRQVAYATRLLGGQGKHKKEIALLAGYSPTMAENAKAKIEDTEGFKNAVIVLAQRSNNLLQAVMAEFEARGLKKFSNADLVKALNAISGAWERIEKSRAPDRLRTPAGNPLRAVFEERVTTRVRTATVSAAAPSPEPAGEAAAASTPGEEDHNDF
jgi:hypothetical protein